MLEQKYIDALHNNCVENTKKITFALSKHSNTVN